MIDAKFLKNLAGAEYVASVPRGETIISMVVCDGDLFIATSKNIYRLIDKKRLEPADACRE